MTFAETLDFLYGNLPMFQRVGNQAFKKDLSNTIMLCRNLGNPQFKFKSVHIAGTNGKGSSAHMIAAVLNRAGFKTGLYTSPHLKKFTERIRVDGKEVEESFVVSFVEKIRKDIEHIRPSFFEITVAMAFDYFAYQEVDIAVVEVGLGGRLDSTNVISPLVSLITNIGYDHQEMLGETLPEIAFEKAGIIKENTPVVISESQSEVKQVFEKSAAEKNSELVFADQIIQIKRKRLEFYHQVVDVLIDGELKYSDIKISLPGEYQLRNLPGIFKSLEILNQNGFHIATDHIINGLAEIQSLTGLKGRWQVLQENPTVICDVGHNLEAWQFILNQLQKYSYQKLWIILGMVKEKKAEQVFTMLPKLAEYYFCQADIPRARPADELFSLAIANELKSKVIMDVNLALEEVLAFASANDLVFIGGSSFVVAELKDL